MERNSDDEIVTEVRAAREAHAARFGFDVTKIFEDLRARQAASGREYERYPARPVEPTEVASGTE